MGEYIFVKDSIHFLEYAIPPALLVTKNPDGDISGAERDQKKKTLKRLRKVLEKM